MSSLDKYFESDVDSIQLCLNPLPLSSTTSSLPFPARVGNQTPKRPTHQLVQITGCRNDTCEASLEF
jgi:hypothetical protein